MRTTTSLSLVLAALASVCVSQDVCARDPQPPTGGKKNIELHSNRDIDILFLIDNSDSMQDKQTNLNLNFPRFIQVLQNIPGGLPNVHLGVASSDVTVLGCGSLNDNGLLQNTPRGPCGASLTNPSDRFIVDIEDPTNPGTRVRNYNGSLADMFSCIAALGTHGCGFEHDLEGIKRALDGVTQPQNANFLRQNAYLAVIILADEDDCSARDPEVFNPSPELNNINSTLGVYSSYRCTEFGVTCDGLASLPRAAADYTSCTPRGDSYLWHPQHYVDFLRSLKDDPKLLLAAAIVGNRTPFGVQINSDGAPELKHSCTACINGQCGGADPAVRIGYFIDQFGDHGTITSICQSDLSDALIEIAKLLAHVVGTPCLEGRIDLTDVDSSNPGVQLNCDVADMGSAIESTLPRCQMQNGPNSATSPSCSSAVCPVTSSTPCWWTENNPGLCPGYLSQTNTALHVERWGTDPPANTHVSAECVLRAGSAASSALSSGALSTPIRRNY
jgi:hypothetical protein